MVKPVLVMIEVMRRSSVFVGINVSQVRVEGRSRSCDGQAADGSQRKGASILTSKTVACTKDAGC